MSIFSRPESPPPRAPSPDYFTGLNPLPIRQKRSQGCIRPSTANSSDDSPKRPTLRAVQSDSTPGAEFLGHNLTHKPSKGILKPSPPPSPSTFSIYSHSSDSSRTLTHHRSLQFALPYRSPPASPVLAGPPPPVPPIPSFVLTDTEKKKPKTSSQPVERKRRQSRAAQMTSRLFTFCTSSRSAAVCTA
ncbi:hypothetical protein BT96DRAFT_996104 [Gymnopus androsaceus JB14]|uniref:Uncharacterized protein n=1 Tax=Gymnopus androsaceus JB14 TaxID=1447944 RepID=A0A6A4HJ80_9AGAR|nr:hypothetical protein BT96DRAFT_996104 [Gymnopus androsaceus JB14]